MRNRRPPNHQAISTTINLRFSKNNKNPQTTFPQQCMHNHITETAEFLISSKTVCDFLPVPSKSLHRFYLLGCQACSGSETVTYQDQNPDWIHSPHCFSPSVHAESFYPTNWEPSSASTSGRELLHPPMCDGTEGVGTQGESFGGHNVHVQSSVTRSHAHRGHGAQWELQNWSAVQQGWIVPTCAVSVRQHMHLFVRWGHKIAHRRKMVFSQKPWSRIIQA